MAIGSNRRDRAARGALGGPAAGSAPRHRRSTRVAPEGSVQALGRVDDVAGALGPGLILGAVVAADPTAGGTNSDPAFGEVDRLRVVVASKLLHRAEPSQRRSNQAMGTDERPPTIGIVGADSWVPKPLEMSRSRPTSSRSASAGLPTSGRSTARSGSAGRPRPRRGSRSNRPAERGGRGCVGLARGAPFDRRGRGRSARLWKRIDDSGR